MYNPTEVKPFFLYKRLKTAAYLRNFKQYNKKHVALFVVRYTKA